MGVWVGWLAFVGVRAVLPKRPASVVPRGGGRRTGLGACGALVFTALFTVGGQVPVPLESLAVAMVGVHTLIGVGEAVITALAVSSIVAVRPDLVYGARRALAQRTLTIREEVAA